MLDKTEEHRDFLRIRFLNKPEIAIPANKTANEIGKMVIIKGLDSAGRRRFLNELFTVFSTNFENF